MDNLKDKLTKAMDTAKEVVNEAGKRTEEFLDRAEVKAKVGELKNLAEDKAEGLAGRADKLKDVVEDKFEVLKNRAEEIKDVVENKADAFKDKIKK